MGRVRTKTVKRAAKVLLERYYAKLTNDFHINKRILSEVAKVPTKKLRNKIAGFATHLVKRIQKGPVKGISLKVQEQERQKRLDWVPKQSEINIEKVAIDTETSEMIKKRYGEDFYGKINERLEVKASVIDTGKRGAKRYPNKNRGDNKQRGGERKPRENREGREGREVRENKGQKKEEKPEQKKEGEKQAPKREGRKRGNRQGQQ